MKKFIFLLTIILLNYSSCVAIEEVNLEKEGINLDRLSDIYYGKVDDKEKIPSVFKLFTEKGIEFENSPINSVKASFLYGSEMNYFNQRNKSSYFKHDFTVIEPMVRVKFNENKTNAMFTINIARSLDGYSNDFTQKINKICISHEINDNQSIVIGQADRVPNTFNGSISYMNQDMVLKSQLGRTFGNVRSVGVRNVAKYKYIDYDIGFYDSTRYMKDFSQGTEFAGNVLIKPFANTDSEISDFKVGAAYNIGNYYTNYNQYALYTSYDYNKFHIKAEYANADGYNGIVNSQNKADGFYTLSSYEIHPKLSVLGRYDYFNPNNINSSSVTQEYSVGLTYKPFKNMKILLNFVRRNYSHSPDSNLVLFATKFII